MKIGLGEKIKKKKYICINKYIKAKYLQLSLAKKIFKHQTDFPLIFLLRFRFIFSFNVYLYNYMCILCFIVVEVIILKSEMI